MSHSEYLQVALSAVQKAEKVIKKYYAEEIRASLKPDFSPVTIADKEAERIIRQEILHAFPDHQILGEEQGKTNTDSPFTWVIDPIDGTKNYMRKVPLFGTQLALMHEGTVILGVSNAPELNELVYAEKGKGAYLNNTHIHVSSIDAMSDAYLSFGSLRYFQEEKVLEPLLQIETNTLGHRGFGDLWAYHLLAQGKVDIVIEAKIKIWDIAALSLIVSEAGGVMTDFSGKAVTEDTTEIIATNGLLQDQVFEYFNKGV